MNKIDKLILASKSEIRRTLLENARLEFHVENASVDEDAIKQSLEEDKATPEQVAETLAEFKAQKISQKYPEHLIIGCDQVLAINNIIFSKAKTQENAFAQLVALRGKTHTLPTAVVVVKGGQRLWHHISSPELTMRFFDDDFIHQYLEKVGNNVLKSVGCYQLENHGIHLFHEIKGDYFSILGLPLLPLLGFLREHGIGL